MATSVTDKPDESRYEISVDGTVAGFTVYHLFRTRAAFVHTEIDPAFGGRGLATELIRTALDDARARGWSVEPFCPFVRAFIAKHPDYVDLVPEADRERFGLSAG